MTEHTRQNASDPLAARQALRREKIAARQRMPESVHRDASSAICHHLADFLLARPPGVIAFCAPMRGEADCRPLIERLLAAGWQAAMPVVRALHAPMEFFAWWPQAPMDFDPYGIPVPATHRCRAPDVLLLPLVAFDAAGYRLGYGGGYFDRTLAAMQPRPLTIGVGFDLGAVADLHPQPHDIPLELIVTESGIRSFQRP
jgi:5-formyltetrahydrofolate cyclo-ligase